MMYLYVIWIGQHVYNIIMTGRYIIRNIFAVINREIVVIVYESIHFVEKTHLINCSGKKFELFVLIWIKITKK